MSSKADQQTAEVNGQLWGAQALAWAEHQEPVHIPMYETCFQKTALGQGTAYLDVGCGSGLAAQMASKLNASVTGLDASEELLRVARSRVPSGSFYQGEIEALPFEDDRFDLVAGFNAFQYAGSPKNALIEARRVTKPGGQVVIGVWGDPQGMPAAKVIAAIKPLLPPPPPGTPGPLVLSERSALTDFAVSAGLHPVEMFDVQAPFIYADMDTALLALRSTGLAAKAIQQAGEEAVDQVHREAVTKFLDTSGKVVIGAAFRCLIAKV